MKLSLTNCAIIGAAVLVCSGVQSQSPDERKSGRNIPALQQERIKLLAESVSKCEALFAIGLRGVTEVAQAQIDLLVVQIEYAASNAAKRDLYADLLQKYDVQIDGASRLSKAPPLPVQPGQRNHPQFEATLRMLLLKSERIRFQIELDSLE
jgi:hypothetical protein